MRAAKKNALVEKADKINDLKKNLVVTTQPSKDFNKFGYYDPTGKEEKVYINLNKPGIDIHELEHYVTEDNYMSKINPYSVESYVDSPRELSARSLDLRHYLNTVHKIPAYTPITKEQHQKYVVPYVKGKYGYEESFSNYDNFVKNFTY